MAQLQDLPRYNLAAMVAALICVVLAVLARDPQRSTPEQRRELARPYRFERRALPAVAGPEPRMLRTAAKSFSRMQQWISSISSGVTLADLDGDGIPNDILHTDNRTEQLLVSPAPGSTARYAPFELVNFGHDTKFAGPSGCLVGDFNEDGWPDVMVLFYGRAPLLYLRKPPTGTPHALCAADFHVEEVAADIADEHWGTSAAVQADLDGDGHIDVMVGNYWPDYSNPYDPNCSVPQEMHNNNGWACNGGGIHFLHWERPTRDFPYYFRDVKGLLPERVLRGWTLAIGAQDLDGDGLPDVYVGNDLGPDRMLWNRSSPGYLKFQVVEGQTGLSIPGSFVMGQDKYKGMSCEFADLNGDGIPDFFVSNVATEYGLQESHFLWLSHADGPGFKDGVAPYTQESEALGLSRGGWGWDAKFESFANQIEPDLVQARGFIKGPVDAWPRLQSLAAYNSHFIKAPENWPTFQPGMDISGHEPDGFFVRQPCGRFVDVGAEIGLEEPMVSRGIATADVTGTGRMDFAVANMWGPNYYFENRCPAPKHWLGVRLMLPQQDGKLEVRPGRPPVRGRPAFGATAAVTLPCGRVLKHEVDGGNGHTGRRAPELHFGLGDLPDDAVRLPVALHWRDRNGWLATRKLELARDAWHTVVLGE